MIIYLRGAFYFATQNEILNNSIKHSTVLDRQLAILMQRVKNWWGVNVDPSKTNKE